MSLIVYLAETMLVSGLLWTYYWLLLRNKQFHQYNRYFLLAIPFISFLLPLIRVSITGSSTQHSVRLLKAITVSNWEQAVVITAGHSRFPQIPSLPTLAWALYLAVALFCAVAFLRSLLYIRRIRRKYPFEQMDRIRFYRTPEPGTPFSFMKNIFWNVRIEPHSDTGKQVFLHELYHVRQKHTADLLLLRACTVCCWFNPFFHLVGRELKTIHEFLADRHATSGGNRYDYAELLVWQSLTPSTFSLANPFFHTQIKRRITMITKHTSARYGYFSRILALPMFFFVFCAFALRLTNRNDSHNSTTATVKPLTVVIDAGHGGMDNGTSSETGILEKNINLAIAQQVSRLSADYPVHVVMTREIDQLPGNAPTVRQGLLNRISIANASKADLFISIHTNADQFPTTNKSGFSVYYSEKNTHQQQNRQLGSALTASLNQTYPVSQDLIKIKTHVLILDDAPMPSIILECGYINNTSDLSFIMQPKNQEKIARDILDGILSYQQGTATDASPGMDASVSEKQPAPDQDALEAEAMDTVGLPKKEMANNPAGDKKIFTKVENEPEFPGGQQGWSAYLNKNLVYPEAAIKKEIQGTVLTQFIVMANGMVTDVKILKSPNKLLSAETLRIIRKSGPWLPATEAGQKVNCYKKQPLVFKLQP